MVAREEVVEDPLHPPQTDISLEGAATVMESGTKLVSVLLKEVEVLHLLSPLLHSRGENICPPPLPLSCCHHS